MSDAQAVLESKRRGNRALVGAIILVAIDYGTFAILSNFIGGLCTKLNAGVTEVVLMFTVTALFGLLAGIVSAGFIERVSARLLATIGSLCFMAYFIIMGLGHSLMALYVGAALFGISNALAGYTTLQPVISWWHATNLGKKISFLTIAAGVGAMILSIGITQFMSIVGFDQALLIAGIVLGAIMILCSLFLISDKPESYGLKPYGFAEAAAAPAGQEADVTIGAPLKASLKNASCLMVMLAVLIGAVAGTGFVNNEAYIYATYGLDERGAAAMISVYSLVAIAWTFAYGALVDRLGAGRATALFGAVTAVVFVVAAILPGKAGALFMAITFGCHATYAMLGAVILGEMFGPRASGTLIVISNVWASVGGMFGPLLASALYVGSGNYRSFLFVGGAIFVVFALLVLFSSSKNAFAKTKALWEMPEVASLRAAGTAIGNR